MLRWKSRSHFFKRQHRYVHTLLLSTGVILVWRGLWGLMDILLLPAWPITSMIVSIVLGVIVLFIDDFELDELH